ncbi:hypothetical protein BC938DRAFT_472040 [Jimgerdemannia flammicorona]|uniref:Secreted protein n=1 Tax=Jimgerdemannia flammicorona TaxID=994334 RepID=A0A433Q6W5_9FUNG|nr:hypothetical protein BC938DRAFT_472040 [Jimgerdemannia flammicorona]
MRMGGLVVVFTRMWASTPASSGNQPCEILCAPTLNTRTLRTQGIDIKKHHVKNKNRQAPKSQDVYLRLLVKWLRMKYFLTELELEVEVAGLIGRTVTGEDESLEGNEMRNT